MKTRKKREKKINKLSTCLRVIPDILNKTELIINSFRNAQFFSLSREKSDPSPAVCTHTVSDFICFSKICDNWQCSKWYCAHAGC